MSAGDWKEMFAACQSGDLELIKYHIKNEIDPNYQHPEFLTTPLNESIRFKQLDIIRYLLENGADPSIKEAWTGETAMSVAEKIKDKAIIQLLKSYS
jgi:ankyrin repeat protein